MSPQLHYGGSSQTPIDLEPQKLVAQIDCRCDAIDDPIRAVTASLEEPLDFPSLQQAVVPGDRVALVIDPALPQRRLVVAGVVKALLRCGISASEIEIVQSQTTNMTHGADPRLGLESEVAGEVGWIQHEPDDRTKLGFLGTFEDDRPMYVNRTVFDADFVLPIGCLRVPTAPDYFGVHTCIFPGLSDRQTIEHYQALRHRDLVYAHECEPHVATERDGVPSASSQHAAQGKRDAAQMAWHLGLAMNVQVVPGPGGKLADVLAGAVAAVEKRGYELCARTWSASVPERASLVIATLDGDPIEQSWENLARCLLAARSVVDDDGAIAVCTEISDRPGAALQAFAECDDLDQALLRIQDEVSADAWPALILAQALQQGSVYLLSHLDEDVVERMGVAPVSRIDQIGRLAQHYPSCTVIHSAQHVEVMTNDEIPNDEGSPKSE